jgi:DNA-binding winged helix-turn-helix (wHTH) protein/Tfp pilus assembly protein PilF
MVFMSNVLSRKNHNGVLASFKVGPWQVDPTANTLSDGHQSKTLEPKVMDLLSLLASEPGRVFSRDELLNTLWPTVVVGEDSLARAVSKLRRALGDQREAPRFIETIPKRGYRLIAEVEKTSHASIPEAVDAHRRWTRASFAGIASLCTFLAAAILGWLWLASDRLEDPGGPVFEMTDRANDLYMRFTRGDNEAAIALYQRAISIQPNYAPAQAGLANALVQRTVRWQGAPGEPSFAQSVGQALAMDLSLDAQQHQVLKRAEELAARAARLAPHNADAHKALGLVLSAQGRVTEAREQYTRAIELDADAWEAMANLAELTRLDGDPENSLYWLERSYATMDRLYPEEPQRIGPWLAPLGVIIGDAHREQDDKAGAEAWYRRVLDELPFEPVATTRLATLLREQGDTQAARALCRELSARIGDYEGCETTP